MSRSGKVSQWRIDVSTGAGILLAQPGQKLADRPAQARDRKNQRIQLLIIPKLGEVKTNWSIFSMASRFHGGQ